MCDPVTATVIAGAMVAGTGYQIYAGERAAKEAKQQREDQERRANEAQRKVEIAEKGKAMGAAARAQRQAAAGQAGYGRRDTILTGPSGLGTDTSSGARSTMLGG